MPDLVREMRINLPVRRLLPGDVFGAFRMTDTHVFDLGTAIDQQGLGIGLQEIVGGNRIKVLHWVFREYEVADIMKPGREEGKL